MTELERFEDKIFYSPDGCWYWTGAPTKQGYGYFHTNGRHIRPHRFSYEIFKGPIPPGLFVCHHCDNRLCVNPDHLFVGTHDDNMRDMTIKGRRMSLPGTTNPRCILDETAVRVIREACALDFHRKQIAAYFKISFMYTYRITYGDVWPHLPVHDRCDRRRKISKREVNYYE